MFGLSHFFSDRFRQRTLERIALSLENRRGHVSSYLRAGGVLGIGLAGSLVRIGLQHTDGALDTGWRQESLMALAGPIPQAWCW